MFDVCIEGIFKSIQGEGAMVGKSAVFIRFAGCNKKPRCSFCDEQFEEYESIGIEEIIERVEKFVPFSMIILTGGEPTIQKELGTLVDELHNKNYFVAIETNGLLPIPNNIDWITCSPKEDGIHASIKMVDEFKFIVDNTPEDVLKKKMKAITSCVKYKEIFLQPLSNKKRFIGKAIEMINHNKEYRLSVQTHKFINIK